MASYLTPEQTRLVGDVARKLAAADPCTGERGVIVKRLAAALGVSANTAYRYLKRYAGWTSGKKPRRGKGETRVPESLCRKIAELMLFPRANGKQVMTLKLAVHIAQSNGEGIADPETGEILMPSVETMSRAMRHYGCHPEQLKKGKPTGRVRSLHPNHTWLLDASVCILYRIRGTNGVVVYVDPYMGEGYDIKADIVLVTHEPDIAARAKRVIKMRDGNIETDVSKDSTI